MSSRWSLVVVCAACHVRTPASPRDADADITLYRDVALIQQRVEINIPAAPTTIVVDVASDVDVATVAVIDRGGLTTVVAHVQPPKLVAAHDDDDDHASPASSAPVHVALDVAAPHAGHYTVALVYITARLTWTAAYTMTTTTARDLASLHGALGVTNASGVAFARAHVAVVDAPTPRWRTRATEQLATELVGGVASTSPITHPRDLGVVALAIGETRIDLAASAAPQPMRSVLVYDPIGTHLDNQGAVPTRDAAIGVTPPPPTAVSESFEIARDAATTEGLPSGPVKLYERTADGSLALLGEATLFDDSTRVAPVDTIPIGTAAGVIAHRERRELTIEDDVRHRVTEEFVITVDNTRDRPASVLVREHLYRGQTWSIAYESTKRPAKEGAQQIALRTDVPAKAQAQITYVVVYSWKP